MKDKVYHVQGIDLVRDILFGTFSTFEKALEYKEKLENSPTNDYFYSFSIEEAELDPEF